MVGNSVKRSRNVIDYAQLSRFSSADIEYRHFFVFLLSTCSIRRTYLSFLERNVERNVVTTTFLLLNKLHKSNKLFYRLFPTHPGFLVPIAGLVALFKITNRFLSPGSFFCLVLREIFVVFKA